MSREPRARRCARVRDADPPSDQLGVIIRKMPAPGQSVNWEIDNDWIERPKNRKAEMGFEPMNNGFAIRPLSPLGYSAGALRVSERYRSCRARSSFGPDDRRAREKMTPKTGLNCDIRSPSIRSGRVHRELWVGGRNDVARIGWLGGSSRSSVRSTGHGGR